MQPHSAITTSQTIQIWTLQWPVANGPTLVLRLRAVCRLVRALRLAAAPRPRPAVRAAVLRPHRGGQQQGHHHHHHHQAPHVGVVTIPV